MRPTRTQLERDDSHDLWICQRRRAQPTWQAGNRLAVIVALAQPPRDADLRAGADADLAGVAESAAWRAVRATDLVVRGAKESTLLLLANVDAESGREIVERLRAEFDALSDGATLDVGLAIAPHDGSSLDALTPRLTPGRAATGRRRPRSSHRSRRNEEAASPHERRGDAADAD